MTDKIHFTFFELPKFKEAISEKDRLGLLFHLLKAKTDDDLEQVKATGVPEIMEVIDVYHAVTVSEEFKEIQLARDIALLRERGMLKKAMEVGELKGERKGILKGRLEGKLEEKLRLTLKFLNTTHMERSEVLKTVGLTEEEFQAGLKELGWPER